MSYSRKYCPPELANVKDVTGMGEYNRDYDVLYPIAAELAPNKKSNIGIYKSNSTLNLNQYLCYYKSTNP